MTEKSIKKAVVEARRFLAAYGEWQEDADKAEIAGYGPFGTAKSGSLRRASLDLTRALAEMRRVEW